MFMPAAFYPGLIRHREEAEAVQGEPEEKEAS